MKTTFEFHGEGYLTISVQGQSATLSKKNSSAELELEDGAEIEAVHSEKEPDEKGKSALGKIAAVIFLLPLVIIALLVLTAIILLDFSDSNGLRAEKFFDENNPFKTRQKFILKKSGETVVFSVSKPVFLKKNLEYTLMPQIICGGEAENCSGHEYYYEQRHTRVIFKLDTYSQCAIIALLTLVLAAFGGFFIFHLTPIAENPVLFILGLLASLPLLASPSFAIWAIVRTCKTFKKTENNILSLVKGKIEK